MIRNIVTMALLLIAFVSVSAQAATIHTQSFPAQGALAHAAPVDIQATTTPLANGGRFISQQATVGTPNSTAGTGKPLFEMASKHWTYTRGVGVIPSQCEAGYHKEGLLCAKDAQTVGSAVKGAVCADGLENSNGLCYTPCADKFTGFGPFCSGNLQELNVANVSAEVAKQHAEALAKFNQPGITLRDEQKPRIKTDLAFGPITCGLAPVFDVTNQLTSQLSGAAIGKVGESIFAGADIKGADGATLWAVPSLNEFVAYDLALKPTCTELADRHVGTLNVDNSVTVKVGTKMFDSLFDNLGGVDAGIAKVSIYELIPFRVYGTTGVTVGSDVKVESTVLKNAAPFMIDGRAHAHQTKLNVTPAMNLWLGMDGYFRITSILTAIPDLLQVGGKVNLNVLNWQLPYQLHEGVREEAGVRKLFIDESLNSNFSAGDGKASPFLNVLGKEVKAFKPEDTRTWTGYQESKNLLTRQASY